MKQLWRQIVVSKIEMQASLLSARGKQEGNALAMMAKRIRSVDTDNLEDLLPVFEATGKGLGHALACYGNRRYVPADPYIMPDQTREAQLGFGCNRIYTLIHHPLDEIIHQRPERLDKIICQREAIQPVMVMQADRRVQASGDDGPGYAGSHNGVAVIEERVSSIGVLIPAKIRPHEGRPVSSCSLGLALFEPPDALSWASFGHAAAH